jgi:hypothetical protein
MLVPLLAAAALADTVTARADTTPRPAAPPSAVVRVMADDTARAPYAFVALGAELRLDGGARKAGDPPGVPAELRVTKRADALTPLLAARVGTGRTLAAVTVELPGAADGAADTVRVRLADVQVVSARLVFPAPAADAEGQRLAQEVALTQLAADRDESARRLAEAEALAAVEARDQRKLVPANALARARDELRVYDLRVAAARRQLALLEERVARAAAPTEEITLRARRAEVVAAAR